MSEPGLFDAIAGKAMAMTGVWLHLAEDSSLHTAARNMFGPSIASLLVTISAVRT